MFSRVLFGAFVSLAVLMPASVVMSQEKKDKPAPPPKTDGDKKPPVAAPAEGKAPGEGMAGDMSPEMRAHMEAAMKAMMPGPEHAKLAKLAGEWTTRTKVAGPGMPPEDTEGTAKIIVAMDGRFIHEESEGVMHGMPYKGTMVVGYNNGTKEYESVWTWSLGTGMMIMRGTSEDAGKTIHYNATYGDETGGRKDMDIVYKMIDDDHFSLWCGHGKMPDGSEGPVMEMQYTRKKP